ncbi:MAG TPA: D-tyrosyl-tRNA(Tyr) deacylase [Eubacteriaceae bacterium]|nr:D-tyrosyl-tRNA(Tyr) deacylase [Eubacteriaceae bacterium]
MRAVIQRVKFASVQINNKVVSKINKGLLVFLGVKEDDNEKDVSYLVDKVINLRIFEDQEEKMNLSLKDISGELLVVSQFTLYGDCKKGRRPSFIKAANPERAKLLYERFINETQKLGIITQHGEFQAHMIVNIENDGPVTILLDSEKQF